MSPMQLYRHLRHRSHLGWPGDCPISSVLTLRVAHSLCHKFLPRKDIESVKVSVNTTGSQGQGKARGYRQRKKCRKIRRRKEEDERRRELDGSKNLPLVI